MPRVLLGLGGLALLAAIVSISVGQGGPGKTVPEGLDEVQRLIAGIPQEGNRLGEEDAPVTIAVFTDLLCSPCADYFVAEIDPLIEAHARDGEASFEVRHISLADPPRVTTVPALAATAAGEQGRQWQYAELLMRNIEDAGAAIGEDDPLLTEIAAATPELELEQWEADRASAEATQLVTADAELAGELGVARGGASVVVDGPRGSEQLEDSPSAAAIREAVARVDGTTGQ